jgi:predicted MFS family arabinose efflux permease
METTINTKANRTALTPAMTGSVTLLISHGIGRFGYPPLIPALIEAKWFSVAQADYLGAGNLTGYILGSMCGTILNRYIPSVTLIRVMLLATAASFALCAFPLSFPLYFIIRLLAGFAGGVIMVVTAPTIFKHTSANRKGLIGGIIFAGVGIGIALAGTIIPFLVKQGLKTTWLTFSGVSLLLILMVWKGWPQGSNEKHLKETINQSENTSVLWSKSIIFLLISYACNAVGFVPHTVFWVDFISRGLHRGIEQGTRFWILLGLATALGPIVTGFIADKVGFARSIRISLLVKAVGVVLPLVSTASWSLALSSVFVGSLALGIASLASGRTTELVGHSQQKQVWSRMTITFSIAHAATAYILSFLFSIQHSYYLLFEIGAATLLIGSILDYLASKTK